jgi:BNR domain protein
VVLSSRISGGRLFNIFHYLSHQNATGAWEATPALSQKEEGGLKALQNSTNGEILFVDAIDNANHRKVRLALQSVPLGPGRANVGIYYKALPSNQRNAPVWKNYTAKDFAKGWSGPLKVSPIGSAYSTMVQQTDGRIAFFYEEETYGKGACYTNMYVPLTLERITDGKFSALHTQLPPKAKRR